MKIQYNDLRDFLQKAKEIGQYNLIEGADWDLEIGAIHELQLWVPESPLLLFDKIKGYPPGYRVVSNHLNSAKLVALNFGLPLEHKGMQLVNGWRAKLKEEYKPVPPVAVKTGPVMENIQTGKDIDISIFPAPKWSPLDGGRYIGTGCIIIQREPDEGFVNLGTYRVMVQDKSTASIFMAPGRHGDIIRRKHWAKGESCPATIVCGSDPLLASVAWTEIPWGIGEYEYTGWLRNKPVEIITDTTNGLPVPATAEIVLEGEIMPPGVDDRPEGPFGEFTGYYGGGARTETAFRIKRVLYRNAPVILGVPHLFGPYEYGSAKNYLNAARVWNELDKQVPGVKGVWISRAAKGMGMAIISLEQRYGGHAKQAAMFTAGYYTMASLNRFIIVVDEDIDPSNTEEVIWALSTRCDPATAIDVVRDCWSTPLDPQLPPEKRKRGDYTLSKGIILACKPYYWIKDFPISVKRSPEVLKATKGKWGKFLYGQH